MLRQLLCPAIIRGAKQKQLLLMCVDSEFQVDDAETDNAREVGLK